MLPTGGVSRSLAVDRYTTTRVATPRRTLPCCLKSVCQNRPRFSNSSFREDPSSGSTLNTLANSWDRPIGSANKLVSSGQEGLTYNDNSGHGFLNDIFAENAIVDDINLNLLEFLESGKLQHKN
ncbi:Polyadenylate-binding protein-interacting protein [Arachis hypogaea]|nr:polyadenylate-binding protein-interacting protein 7 [Arachis hypogaea]QHO56117.1 Polyadenylate-binding protein-interacting protein [Arachis hypogaea]